MQNHLVQRLLLLLVLQAARATEGHGAGLVGSNPEAPEPPAARPTSVESLQKGDRRGEGGRDEDIADENGPGTRQAHEAAEGEEGEGHEESEAGEEQNPHEVELEHIDMAVACMLLGSIAFQMSLFYLLNHPDDDIKLSSWKVISTTISIFVAVLLFHGLSSIIEAATKMWIEERFESEVLGQSLMCFVDAVHFLVWLCITHVTIWWMSRKRPYCPHDRNYHSAPSFLQEGSRHGSHTNLESAETPAVVAEHMDSGMVSYEQQVVCWSSLFSHTTGFSLIHLGARIQRLPVFYDHPWRGFVVVLLLSIMMFGLFAVTEALRKYFAQRHSGSANYLEKWFEEAEEAESDMAQLALSFLSVQTLRYCISGVLPASTGSEFPPTKHSPNCISMLYLFSFAFAGLTCFLTLVVREVRKKEEVSMADVNHTSRWQNLNDILEYLMRWHEILPYITANSTAWCILFASKWLLMWAPTFSGLEFDPNSTTECVRLALLLSLFAFAIIYALDKLADLDCTGDGADTVIRSLINALAILVGYTWEQSFGTGLEEIAELTGCLGTWYPMFAKMLLAVVVCLVVIPAWRLYILKHAITLQMEHDKREEAAKARRRDGEEASDSSYVPLQLQRAAASLDTQGSD